MSDYWNEQLLKKRLSKTRQIVKHRVLKDIGRFYFYFTKEKPGLTVAGRIIFYPGRK